MQQLTNIIFGCLEGQIVHLYATSLLVRGFHLECGGLVWNRSGCLDTQVVHSYMRTFFLGSSRGGIRLV